MERKLNKKRVIIVGAAVLALLLIIGGCITLFTSCGGSKKSKTQPLLCEEPAFPATLKANGGEYTRKLSTYWWVKDVKNGNASIDDLGISSPDSTTIEIEFERDIDLDLFLETLASPVLVPLRENKVHAAQVDDKGDLIYNGGQPAYSNDWATVATSLVCSGPFFIRKLESDLNKEWVLERNKYYNANPEAMEAALRSLGIFDISEVQLAIVETNGTISAYPKPESRPATCGDLHVQGDKGDPPEVLIADGCISTQGLRAAGITPERLRGILRAQSVPPEDVFLLTAGKDGLRCLVKKTLSAEEGDGIR